MKPTDYSIVFEKLDELIIKDELKTDHDDNLDYEQIQKILEMIMELDEPIVTYFSTS